MGQLPEMRGAFAALVIVCIIAGVALAFAIPSLWGLIKPWLHALSS